MFRRQPLVPAIFVASCLVPGLRGVASAQPPAVRLPQGPAGTVTLPVADYDRLLDRAAQPAAAIDTPPVAAIVSRGFLKARVDNGLVRGTLQLDGEVFQRGAAKVPLVGATTLLDARAGGATLPLLNEGDRYWAIFTGPAPFSATLDWAAALSAVPGRASLTLPQPAAGSVSATIDLPGDPAEIRVEPGLMTGRTTQNGRTTIDVMLTAGARTQVSWSVREAAQQPAQAEIRTLADVRSLITIGDAELRMVSLIDITAVRGEPATFQVQLPAGYEVSSITGGAIESSETKGSMVSLTVREPARRRHQFLISLEQARGPGSFKTETAFPSVAGVQRETGEAAVEGIGALDVAAAGDEHLRRMDVREVHASLRALARQPLLAAFRYQRRPAESRVLALDVKRFADAPVIAAAAEHATATTLVTSEGRMLTEVSLRLRNRAQPFMKVTLPGGASLLSVEVAGEAARPVGAADGTRIPLLRSGLRTDDPYTVSFVYLHAGQPFAKRGDAAVLLPKMDLPVSVLEWELFTPERYSVKPIDGNVMPAAVAERAAAAGPPPFVAGLSGGVAGGSGGGSYRPGPGQALPPWGVSIGPGQIVGRVSDATGAAVPGTTITVTDGRSRLAATTDADGYYVVHGVPSSNMLTVTSEMAGFTTVRRTFAYDQRARRVDFQMQVGAITETVTVSAEAPLVNDRTFVTTQAERRAEEAAVQQAPSQNILNLQRRVAGVLPVRMDVPRAGTQHRFVRPLVLDDETRVSFRYKRR